MNDRVKLKKLEIGAHVSESCFASLQQAHYEHFQALVQKHTNIPCKIRQKNVPWCRPRSFHRKLYRGRLKRTRLWPSVLFWWLQEAVCHCCSHPKPEKSAHEAKCHGFWQKNYRFFNKIFTCISTPGTSEAERMLIVSIPRVIFLYSMPVSLVCVGRADKTRWWRIDDLHGESTKFLIEFYDVIHMKYLLLWWQLSSSLLLPCQYPRRAYASYPDLRQGVFHADDPQSRRHQTRWARGVLQTQKYWWKNT